MANEYYITRDTLKLALDITGTDRDALLDVALAAASRAVDDHCGRRFNADATASARVYSPCDHLVRSADGDLMIVHDISSTTDLLVEVGASGGASWAPVTDVETGPDNALALGRPITFLRSLGGSWWTYTAGTGRIRVTAHWGWPAVPEPIAQVTLSLAARLADNPKGLTSKSVADRSQTFPAARLTELEYQLLAEYRLS